MYSEKNLTSLSIHKERRYIFGMSYACIRFVVFPLLSFLSVRPILGQFSRRASAKAETCQVLIIVASFIHNV